MSDDIPMPPCVPPLNQRAMERYLNDALFYNAVNLLHHGGFTDDDLKMMGWLVGELNKGKSRHV